jgi:predicted nucleic acid-binding Zn ribbon protein
MPANSATPPPVKVILGCSKCGASLPDDAQFCLKCGKPVSMPPKEVTVVELGPAIETKPRRKRGVILWLLFALLLVTLLWMATSDNSLAQGLQEMVGWKHDQGILETPFTVSAHNFRYYKFALPEGSVNVAIMGQFTSSAEASKSPGHNVKNEDKAADSDIEVYVLSEPAFTVWQNGYATSSVFESGRVSKGKVEADLPAGAGIYYLVFSNKFSAKNPKNVNATVLLRYKSWLPDSVRSAKARLSNWLGW